MNEDALDFSGAEATSSVEVYSAWITTIAPIAALVLFVSIVALSAWLGVRWNRHSTHRQLRLGNLAPSLRLVVAIVFLSLLAVQVLAVLDVYFQTQRVHGTTEEYFQHMSWQRLLGVSHAHVFGYAIMYGLMGILVSLTSLGEVWKCSLVSALLWAGLFDVASWWGIKRFHANFEWLALATGVVTGIASLVALVVVVRELSGSTQPPES